MGFYTDRIVPRLVDLTCGLGALAPLRRATCAGLSGTVLEIGFGSGLNVPFYPPGVDTVVAVEPSDTAWRLAAGRLADTTVPVVRSGLDGQSLPCDDDSADCALVTWTLCTIPDVDAALREVRRVVRPGGTVHFLEHGLAPEPGMQRWQRRLEPVQKRVAGGCHLTRDIPALLRGAGFGLVEVTSRYGDGTPKIMGTVSQGVARVG